MRHASLIIIIIIITRIVTNILFRATGEFISLCVPVLRDDPVCTEESERDPRLGKEVKHRLNSLRI